MKNEENQRLAIRDYSLNNKCVNFCKVNFSTYYRKLQLQANRMGLSEEVLIKPIFDNNYVVRNLCAVGGLVRKNTMYREKQIE